MPTFKLHSSDRNNSSNIYPTMDFSLNHSVGQQAILMYSEVPKIISANIQLFILKILFRKWIRLSGRVLNSNVSFFSECTYPTWPPSINPEIVKKEVSTIKMEYYRRSIFWVSICPCQFQRFPWIRPDSGSAISTQHEQISHSLNKSLTGQWHFSSALV